MILGGAIQDALAAATFVIIAAATAPAIRVVDVIRGMLAVERHVVHVVAIHMRQMQACLLVCHVLNVDLVSIASIVVEQVVGSVHHANPAHQASSE